MRELSHWTITGLLKGGESTQFQIIFMSRQAVGSQNYGTTIRDSSTSPYKLLPQPTEKPQTQKFFQHSEFIKHWRIYCLKNETNFPARESQNFQLHTLLTQKEGPDHNSMLDFPPQKIQQATSLRNYLSPDLRSALTPVLQLIPKLFCCDSPGPGSDFESASSQIISACSLNEQLRTTRNHLKLCFSSQWRQRQTTIFVLLHCYRVEGQEENFSRAHLVNQRGLILQTITNIKYSEMAQFLVRILQRHYRLVKRLYIVGPVRNIVDLDAYEQFRQHIPAETIVMVSIRQPRVYCWENQDCNWIQNPFLPGGLIGIVGDFQILFWLNQGTQIQQMQQGLQKLSKVLQQQRQLASFYQRMDYFGDYFSQKQMLLRLFAFHFNFTTVHPMELQSKQSLLAAVNNSQLQRQQDAQNRPHHQIAHIHETHRTPLHCLLCKKRTKVKCQGCWRGLNRIFGLCRKECFDQFHADIDQYIHFVKQNKRKVQFSDSNQSAPEDQAEDSLSSLPEKKTKLLPTRQICQPDDQVQQLLKITPGQQLVAKWTHEAQKAERELFELRKNGDLGLINERVIKKQCHIHNLMNQLSQRMLTLSESARRRTRPG